MMTSTELAPDLAASRTLQSCPRCRSIEIEPVKPIPNVNLRDAAGTAWADCWAGHGGLATRFLVRWVCVETANALRERYRCAHCGWGFREVQP